MFNKVLLIGRLAADPEVRYTKGETAYAICSFPLAVQRPDKNKTVDFVPCECWGQSAEYVGNNIGKGRLVSVEGSIQIQKWTDTEGKKLSKTLVNATRVISLEKGEKKEEAVADEPRDEVAEFEDPFA